MRHWQRPFSLLVGLLLIAVLLAWVGVADVLGRMANVAIPAVVLTAGLVALAALLGAINTYQLLKVGGNMPPFRTYLPLYWMSWSFGLVLPGQIGDVATLSALLHRQGIPLTKSLGRTLTDKATSFAVFILAALPAVPSLLQYTRLPDIQAGSAILAALLGMTVLAGLFFLVRRKTWVNKLVELARQVPVEMGILIRHHPLSLAGNFLLTIVKLFATAASYWVILEAVSPVSPPSLVAVASLMSVSALVAYIPITFNGIGTAELAGVAAFGSAGLPAASIVSAYLALRLVVIAVAWIPTALWLLALGLGRKPGC